MKVIVKFFVISGMFLFLLNTAYSAAPGVVGPGDENYQVDIDSGIATGDCKCPSGSCKTNADCSGGMVCSSYSKPCSMNYGGTIMTPTINCGRCTAVSGGGGDTGGTGGTSNPNPTTVCAEWTSTNFTKCNENENGVRRSFKTCLRCGYECPYGPYVQGSFKCYEYEGNDDRPNNNNCGEALSERYDAVAESCETIVKTCCPDGTWSQGVNLSRKLRTNPCHPSTFCTSNQCWDGSECADKEAVSRNCSGNITNSTGGTQTRTASCSKGDGWTYGSWSGTCTCKSGYTWNGSSCKGSTSGTGGINCPSGQYATTNANGSPCCEYNNCGKIIDSYNNKGACRCDKKENTTINSGSGIGGGSGGMGGGNNSLINK